MPRKVSTAASGCRPSQRQASPTASGKIINIDGQANEMRVRLAGEFVTPCPKRRACPTPAPAKAPAPVAAGH